MRFHDSHFSSKIARIRCSGDSFPIDSYALNWQNHGHMISPSNLQTKGLLARASDRAMRVNATACNATDLIMP